ncbi:MAG: futalosine hydrolase [Desulfobulbus sp.]|nr:futalosine hydrolase [Desulfobulbus sp.]
MILITAATSFEMEAFRSCCRSSSGWTSILTGIGPVEAALQVTAFLAQTDEPIAAVINFGVGGAYIRQSDGAGLLDLCLADREILGDLGICAGDQMEPLRGESLEIIDTFPLDCPEVDTIAALLERLHIPFRRGTFVTVNCVSGSRRRGENLTRQHQALCENMEGAAVARVCRHFYLPLIEIRCISNLVEDRNTQNWRLRDACRRCGRAVAQVVEGLMHV